jgi:hypothetical protein
VAQYAEAWNGEGEVFYDQWCNKGLALEKLGRNSDAVAAFAKARQLEFIAVSNPSSFFVPSIDFLDQKLHRQ